MNPFRETVSTSWMRAAGAGLMFRPATDADLPFLGRLYASTRIEELEVTSWTDEQKAAFLDMQFRAQHAHYIKHYPADYGRERAGEDIAALSRARVIRHILVWTSPSPATAAGFGTALPAI